MQNPRMQGGGIMSDCITCDSILSGAGGIRCKLLMYRKYIIGAVIGGIIVFCALKAKGGKHAGK